jgi:hypothetical protein
MRQGKRAVGSDSSTMMQQSLNSFRTISGRSGVKESSSFRQGLGLIICLIPVEPVERRGESRCPTSR